MNLKKTLFLFNVAFLFSAIIFAQNKVTATEFSDVYILPMKIQGKTFQFLFDTGASKSLINEEALESLEVKKLDSLEITDAHGNSKKLGLADLGTISIGFRDFNEIELLILPEEGNSYRDIFGCQKIDGVIGFDIIKKAKWKINWSTKTFEIGENLSEWDLNNYKKIKLDIPKNSHYAAVKIKANGKKFYAKLDSGNNSFLSLGNRTYSYLKDKLGNLHTISKEGRTSTGVYGQNYGITNYTIFQEIKIDKISLKNKIVMNSSTTNNLLGTKFLNNYITVINLEDEEILVHQMPGDFLMDDEIKKFPVDIKPNYETQELIIGNIWQAHSTKSSFENETKVLKINDNDVSNFTKEQLCQFWNNDWKTLSSLDELEIVVEHSEGNKKISIKKEDLLNKDS